MNEGNKTKICTIRVDPWLISNVTPKRQWIWTLQHPNTQIQRYFGLITQSSKHKAWNKHQIALKRALMEV